MKIFNQNFIFLPALHTTWLSKRAYDYTLKYNNYQNRSIDLFALEKQFG